MFVLFPSLTLKHLALQSINCKTTFTHNAFRRCNVRFYAFVRQRFPKQLYAKPPAASLLTPLLLAVRTLPCFVFFPAHFRAKERLLVVYPIWVMWSEYRRYVTEMNWPWGPGKEALKCYLPRLRLRDSAAFDFLRRLKNLDLPCEYDDIFIKKSILLLRQEVLLVLEDKTLATSSTRAQMRYLEVWVLETLWSYPFISIPSYTTRTSERFNFK